MRISSYPRGLLQLLGSQNMGVTPQNLGDVVAPVIDTGEMYQAQYLDAINTNGVAIVAGFQRCTVVEQDGIYRVHQLTANVSVVAADTAKTLSFAPAIGIGRNGVSAVGLLSDLQDTVAGTREWFKAADLGLPIWLPAGTQIGVYITNISAAYTAGSLAYAGIVLNRFRAGG